MPIETDKEDVIPETEELRRLIDSSKPKFVTYRASENTTSLYAKSTGMIASAIITIDADSLRAFKVGENKVKYLFKVE